MHRQVLLFILFGFSVGHIMAQQTLSVPTISSSTTGNGNFYHANRNEPPRAIEFKERTVTAVQFLDNINQYFNIPSEFTFIETESNTDHLGMRHRLMQQYYKGIPIEGLGYRVHEKDGFVTSANGRAVREIDLDIQTVLSEEQAFHLAVTYLQAKDTAFGNGKKLIVSKDFTFAPHSFSVAFQFDIDVSLIERWRISINARDGHVINKVSLVNTCHNEEEPPLPYGTGTGMTNYYGNKTIRVEKYENGSSRLVGQTESGGIIGTYDFRNASVFEWSFGFNTKAYDIYSSNNMYNHSNHKPAVSVQWAAEQAYEYYFKMHNRNSFDNKGTAIRSYVHVDKGLNNAFWSRNTLLFGDGSNNNPLVELDIVAHELTHGVTQYEAALQYYNEPGALNESFSDIFAKAVEFDTFGDSATWQLGKYYREGGARDFSDPNLKGQPDTYRGDMWYTGLEDNGGVHYNSGVQNFWFYLLCEGGSGINDHNLSYSVNSIGMEAAVNIAYRNLSEYLGSVSDYLDSRIGSLLATADLYGKHSAVYQEVDRAWDAVGVIDEPIITGLELYDITATTVKIKGSFLPRGDTVSYHFEYGTTPALGSVSKSYQYKGTVNGALTGLQSSTHYYLRLVATNENGSSYSAVKDFTTISLAPLVKIKQTVDVTETTATLYGELNPNSLFTSFYFEYGLTPALGMVTPIYPLSDTTEYVNVSASVTELQPRQVYYYRLVATNSFASTVTTQTNFFTAVKPVISSFTPISATSGTEVTITGQNFNPLSEKNLVSFGATRATILSSSSTEIKVKVPIGASFGTISLLDTESGLIAQSIQEFVPTFAGESEKESLQLRVGINESAVWRTVVEDMDGDHKPDIVGVHYESFSVFQNVNQGGDITEESFVRNYISVPGLYGSSGFQVVDFDGNGLKDLVGLSQNTLRLYPNFSVPGYIFFGTPVELSIGNLGKLTFGDFDSDGRIDIAGTTTTIDQSTLTIIRNENPKGILSANNFAKRYVKTVPYYIYFLTTGDVNNDGTTDLMVGPHYTNFLSILKNNSQPGAFEFEEHIVRDSTRGRYTRYVAADLNQDGRKDIISHSPNTIGNLAIFENQGTSPGITLARPVVALSDNTGNAVQPADINGDQKVDLLVGTGNRTFFLMENRADAGATLSNLSLQKFKEYGKRVPDFHSGDVEERLTINDLNGDGRPEVIATYSYGYGPHDGYNMEIWQNSPNDCPDPSGIDLEVSRNSATIVLPPNTTFDQFEIEYTSSRYVNWRMAYSTTITNLSTGSYKLRARAKCYLSFTDYHYIDFATTCVDINSFSIASIGIDNVFLSAASLSSFEVQYSLTDKEEWKTMPQYSNQLTGLLPGTTYALRFRGRCSTPGEFKYDEFTTQCPALSGLNVTDIIHNKAMVNWTSNYSGKVILEYSANNIDWTLIDETRTMFPLVPGRQYVVRGRLECTDTDSDFIYKSFITPCPGISSLYVDNVTPFSARINWVDKSETGSYFLTYSITSGGPAKTVEVTSTSFILQDLNVGTQYTVAVAPKCIDTENFTATNFNTVCYVPFNLSADVVTPTVAELSWDDHFGDLPYSVDYSISGSKNWQTTETEATTISLTELRPGTQYEARVHITCPSERASYVSVLFQTGLYEETLYAPNPANNQVTIYPSKNLIGSYFSILDNSGRGVVNGELSGYTIDLSDFPPGIYTLKIDGEKPMRIVKN